MSRITIDSVLGFGGVHPDESSNAVKWSARMEPAMLLIAMWIVLEWLLYSKGFLSPAHRQISDWLIWGFFTAETLLLVSLCQHKIRYLLNNWANVLIVLCAFPLLFEQVQEVAVLRILRLFFMIGLFAHNVAVIRNVLSQNHLGKTLIIATLFITGGGVVIATLDPAIKTVWDGIWWAWVTVTTVGYGDVVPVSTEGRVFASILMLVGITMMSLFTANVSAYLLSKQTQKEIRYDQRELKKLLQLEDRLDTIEKKLDRLLDNDPKDHQ